jgi:hypothetical protein
MPGPLLTQASGTTCPHTAPSSPVPSSPRVLAGGAPVLTVADQFPVAGCPFQVPVGAGTKPQPCVRIQWLVPAARVLVNGQPALLATSTGLAMSAEGIPAGPPIVTAPQPRVVGS